MTIKPPQPALDRHDPSSLTTSSPSPQSGAPNMKNLSTGTGLALLATAIVAYPIVNRISSVDQTAHASVPVAAIAAAATAQANPEPTIVWYGVASNSTQFVYNGNNGFMLLRAWSDGRVEGLLRHIDAAYGGGPCSGVYPYSQCPNTQGWFVISDPSNGYAYRSDITADQVVDGADLATMLADWGDAPRYDIPPSDCPLNLINP